MGLSRACGYGIRAVLYLASRSDKRPARVKEIADNLHIPHPYLSKITQLLAREGIFCTHRGPGGGVTLACSSRELTLGQVVNAIDGSRDTPICVLGLPGCLAGEPCPFSECRNTIQGGIAELLDHKSVFQLAKQLEMNSGLNVTKNDKKIIF